MSEFAVLLWPQLRQPSLFLPLLGLEIQFTSPQHFLKFKTEKVNKLTSILNEKILVHEWNFSRKTTRIWNSQFSFARKGWWPRNSTFVRLPTDRAYPPNKKGAYVIFIYICGENKLLHSVVELDGCKIFQMDACRLFSYSCCTWKIVDSWRFSVSFILCWRVKINFLNKYKLIN